MWTALYLSMSIAAWRVWRRGRSVEASAAQRAAVRGALIVYVMQLALNGSWSPVFFGLKRVDLALAVIVLMLVAIAETMRRFARIDRAAAWLLAPYLGWVSFATVLNSGQVPSL